MRFGGGENKREILDRFFDFMIDVYRKYPTSNIVVFSHGRAISIVESEYCTINHIEKSHKHTENGSVKQISMGNIEAQRLRRFLASSHTS